MPFWGRKDGDLVRDVPAYRRIMPHLMRRRNEAAVYFEQRLDAEAVLAFVEAWNASHAQRITFFHPFLWALVETLHERPRLNRFTRGARLYQRRGIDVSFSAKKRLDDAAPVVVVRQRFEPGQPFGALVAQVAAAVGDGKSDRVSHVDKELSLFLALPEPILSAAVRLVMWLDQWNLAPWALIKEDPMYASAFVANLGSLKLDAAYHHLYEYGNIPIFATIGRIEEVLVPDGRGGVSTRRQVVLKWTLDERIEDGLYCARALERMRARLERLEGLGLEDPAPAAVAE